MLERRKFPSPNFSKILDQLAVNLEKKLVKKKKKNYFFFYHSQANCVPCGFEATPKRTA
jgi:hypothetical protein